MMRVLSYFETVEREGERRVGGKRRRERQRQGEKESERKKWEISKGRKREGNGGPPAPPRLPQYHLRGRTQPPARSFLIICSIWADPTLFSLKITRRKCFKFYTTCPPSPMNFHTRAS